MTTVQCDQKDCRYFEDGICRADKIDLEMWIALNMSKNMGRRGLWCNRHDVADNRKEKV